MTLCFRYNLKSHNFNNLIYFSRHKYFISHASSVKIFDRNRKSPNRVGSCRNFSVDSARTAYANFFKCITESDTVGVVKDSLVAVHDVGGLSWAGTILCTTLGLRCLITFPLGVYQAYVIAKLELAKVEFAETVKELKMETAVAIKRFGWTNEQARSVYNASMRKQWRLLIERENCHPLKSSLVVFIQLPLWILMSFALRCMAYQYGKDPAQSAAIAGQLSEESFLWLPSLLMPDPTGIIPLTVTLANLTIIEMQACSKPKQTRAQKILTNIFRGVAVVSLPIALGVPSCMSLYWATSSVLALSQNVALMSPKIRDYFNIPITPSTQDEPFNYAWNNFIEKWSFRKKLDNNGM